MNKKGFTLVELLAVIIILSLLALIASTSVTKIVKDSKSELYNTQIELIKSAAEAWGADNLYDLPDAGTCKYLTLYDLKEYGLIDPDIQNPKIDEKFSNGLKIKISGEQNSMGLNNISYEVDSKDIEDCEAIYSICKLIDDADDSNSITAGDKYQCRVKDNMEEEFEHGYYFYVLASKTDGTTNLIMDQNTNSDGTPAGMTGVTQYTSVATGGTAVAQYNLVAWNNESGQSTNAYGPVTAMNFLYNATKDWTNVEPVNYTYNDKEVQGTTNADTSYTSFVSTDGVALITPLAGDSVTIGTSDTPLRARMPIYAGDTNITEVAGKTDTNSYLYDNLDSSGLDGYWTLSSYTGDHTLAQMVYWSGDVIGTSVLNDTGSGVRPVITVKF